MPERSFFSKERRPIKETLFSKGKEKRPYLVKTKNLISKEKETLFSKEKRPYLVKERGLFRKCLSCAMFLSVLSSNIFVSKETN